MCSDLPLREKTGLEPAIGVFHDRLYRKRAGRLVDGGADVRDFSGECAARKRLDDELHLLAGLDHRGMFFLDRRLQLERIHLDDRHDRRVLADVLAGLHEPFGHRAGHRRADDGIVQLFPCEIVRGTSILQARLQRVDVVERRLIVRLGDFQSCLGGLAVDLRQQPAPAQLLRSRERCVGIVVVRGRLAD